jgi:hypothetical protein
MRFTFFLDCVDRYSCLRRQTLTIDDGAQSNTVRLDSGFLRSVDGDPREHRQRCDRYDEEGTIRPVVDRRAAKRERVRHEHAAKQ